MNVTERYGDYLRIRREAAGLSQRALGEALGVSHVYVSTVERGLCLLSRAREGQATTLLQLDPGRLESLRAMETGQVSTAGLSPAAVERVARLAVSLRDAAH